MGMRGHKANPYVARYRARRRQVDHVVPKELLEQSPRDPIVTKPKAAADAPAPPSATPAGTSTKSAAKPPADPKPPAA